MTWAQARAAQILEHFFFLSFSFKPCILMEIAYILLHSQRLSQSHWASVVESIEFAATTTSQIFTPLAHQALWLPPSNAIK